MKPGIYEAMLPFDEMVRAADLQGCYVQEWDAHVMRTICSPQGEDEPWWVIIVLGELSGERPVVESVGELADLWQITSLEECRTNVEVGHDALGAMVHKR